MKYGQRLFIASFLLPPLAIYTVFVLSPYAQAFYVSMTNWSGLSGTKEWVGFDNYKYLWTFDSEFRRSLVHNAILVLTVPIITVSIALFLAYMLNVGGFRGAGGVRGVGGSKSYKVLYFFPYVLSVSIVAVLWQFIFNPSIGLVNSALRFDRVTAYGQRLNIAAGTAVRFEPGDEREVELVPLGGQRIVHGLNGLVNGSLDDAAVRARALASVKP